MRFIFYTKVESINNKLTNNFGQRRMGKQKVEFNDCCHGWKVGEIYFSIKLVSQIIILLTNTQKMNFVLNISNGGTVYVQQPNLLTVYSQLSNAWTVFFQLPKGKKNSVWPSVDCSNSVCKIVLLLDSVFLTVRWLESVCPTVEWLVTVFLTGQPFFKRH